LPRDQVTTGVSVSMRLAEGLTVSLGYEALLAPADASPRRQVRKWTASFEWKVADEAYLAGDVSMLWNSDLGTVKQNLRETGK
jgi:hypothetical protein